MKKRIIGGILAICMLVAVLSVCPGAVTVSAAQANPTLNSGDAGYAEADLSTADPVLTNMTVGHWLRATNSSIDFGAAPNGDPCWVINTGNADSYVGLHLRLTEPFFEGYKDEKVILEVEYYKTATTRLRTTYLHPLGYEATAMETVGKDEIAAAEDGWNTWTATLDGVDNSRTEPYGHLTPLFPADDTAVYYIHINTMGGWGDYASGNVYIRSIKVYVSEGPAVQSSVDTTNHTGLIFKNDEKLDIPVTLTNTTEENQTVDVSVSLKNYDGETLEQLLETGLTIEAEKTHVLDMDYSAASAYGVYYLEVEIKNSATGVLLERITYSFSRALSADSAMDLIGICQLDKYGEYTNKLSIAQDAGFSWRRDDFTWDKVEKEKGKYVFPEDWDTMLDASKASGMSTLAVLAYNNSLYGSCDPSSDEWITAFANYCGAMAKQYKGKIEAYELFNEWNHGLNIVPEAYRDGASYARVMVPAALAIRAADPDAKIITAGTAGYDLNWVKTAMNTSVTWNGKTYTLADVVDGVGYHPYVYMSTPNSPDHDKIANSPAAFKSLFPNHEIWITEIGFPTQAGEQGLAEDVAAAHLVQMFADMLADGLVDKVFWYNLQNNGIDEDEKEHNFGLIRCWQNEEVPYAAKPAYLTMSAMNALLSGATNGKVVDLGKDVHAVSFDVSGKKMIVVWTNEGDTSVHLKVDGQNVKAYDMYGNPLEANIVNGLLSAVVSKNPIYLEMESVEVVKGGISVTQNKFDAAPDNTLKVEIVRDNGFEAMSGEYDVDMPYGWKAEGTAFSAGSGKVTDNLQIKVPANCKPGEYTITIVPTSGDTAMGMVTLTVTVSNTIQINPSVELDEAGNPTYKLEVMIQGSTSGSVTLKAPTDWVSLNETKSYTAKDGETVYIYFDVPKDLDIHTIYNVEIEANVGGVKQKLTKNVSFYYAKKTESNITVDGVIDGEWDGYASITLGEDNWHALASEGYSGTTATAYTKWNDEYFYLAVVVKEAVHHQANEGTLIWSGDCIQIGIDPGRQSKPAAAMFNEIGFALSSANNTVGSHMWSTTTGSFDLSACTFAVVRNEENGTTTYEAAIPWDVLVPDGEIADLNNVGFGIVVNEDTGNGRVGVLQYMDGIANGKDATKFGDLILEGAVRSNDPVDPTNPTDPTDPNSGDPAAPGDKDSPGYWWILLIVLPLFAAVVYFVIKDDIKKEKKNTEE